jgi:hypothetical protein
MSVWQSLYTIFSYCAMEQCTYFSCNEGKSAASFCHQVAASVPDMFCNFYLVKNKEIYKKSATTEARAKTNTYLQPLEF